MHYLVLSPPPPVVETSRLDIAIVGLKFGRTILDQLHREPNAHLFKVNAVCDFQDSLVREAVEALGVRGYHSLDELLEKDPSPVIGLFTAPRGRARLIRKILRAGRDVMTTKPFELDPCEAQSVMEEAVALGRIIHLNSPAPTPPEDLQLIRDWRYAYDLGRPVGGSARVWASYNEKADGSWLDDPTSCPAAPLFRLGIYLFNDFNYIFGSADSIQLMTSSVRTGRPTPDNAQVNIKYRNGALGQIYASFCIEDGDHYQNSMVINFERGTIYRNAGGLRGATDMDQTEVVLVGQGKTSRREVLQQIQVKDSSGNYQWAVLSEAVLTRQLAPEAFIFDVVESVRFVDALQRAEKTGHTHV